MRPDAELLAWVAGERIKATILEKQALEAFG
jgi:hypothetical protein